MTAQLQQTSPKTGQVSISYNKIIGLLSLSYKIFSPNQPSRTSRPEGLYASRKEFLTFKAVPPLEGPPFFAALAKSLIEMHRSGA